MQIPGYRIERELGHGGMATVYLAEQESLGRKVALKVMAAALSADRSFSERFIKEAKTVAQLSHPHIVSIYDVGVVDHHHYLTLEYIGGGDLKQRIRKGPIPPNQAVSILKQVGSALDYAHSKGYVHRDVKPENILFREDGSVVLTDFGIAKAIGSGTRMTGTGMSIGTPHYMSPEQARGRPVDGRSDLYSLGVVFYEMLTGKCPYEAEDSFAVSLMHINEPIPKLPPMLSRFQGWLNKNMAKEPSERVQSFSKSISMLNQNETSKAEYLPEGKALSSVVTPVQKTEVYDRGAKQSEAEEKTEKKSLGCFVPILIIGLLIIAGIVAVMIDEENRRKDYQKLTVRSEETNYEKKREELKRIPDLLEGARRNMENMQYTTPANDNAHYKYTEVLRIDPQNNEAERGLMKIVDAYVSMAKKAFRDNKWDKGSDLMGKAHPIARSLPGFSQRKNKSGPSGMVAIRGGCFSMGSGSYTDEPKHQVCVDDFSMDAYEVTQYDFKRVTGKDPSAFDWCGGDCPVDAVTWQEAHDYCTKVGKRLPTEAEWEFAARERGRNVMYGTGKDTISCSNVQYVECKDAPKPVGSFRPNALGLYDMSGNVWEWVGDWYEADYYKRSPERNPKGPRSGEKRVLRGGSWLSSPRVVRAAFRATYTPTYRYNSNGFRCAQ